MGHCSYGAHIYTKTHRKYYAGTHFWGVLLVPGNQQSPCDISNQLTRRSLRDLVQLYGPFWAYNRNTFRLHLCVCLSLTSHQPSPRKMCIEQLTSGAAGWYVHQIRSAILYMSWTQKKLKIVSDTYPLKNTFYGSWTTSSPAPLSESTNCEKAGYPYAQKYSEVANCVPYSIHSEKLVFDVHRFNTFDLFVLYFKIVWVESANSQWNFALNDVNNTFILHVFLKRG